MDSSNTLLLALCLAAAAATTAHHVWWRSRNKSNLPPGPPGLPILGNVLDVPATEPWVAFKKLGDKYGDLVHVRVLMQDMIILNSHEAVKDLLEKRSQNYSNRPYVPGNDMLGPAWNTGFLPYNEELKAHRKIFQQALRPESIASYRPMQSVKTRQLLKNISHSPADFDQHLRTYATSITMAATYDYHPTLEDDLMLNNLKELDEIANFVLSPGRSALFTIFPFLMHIPPWFPGAIPQRVAAKGRELLDWWLTYPVQYVKDTMADRTVAPCIVAEALSRIDEEQADAGNVIQFVQGAAITSLIAASGTTDSVLQVFVLAMTLYPDVQKRAQAEIQAIIGTNRLPEFSDRPNIPYIEGVVRETLRWFPVLPCSLFRSVANDDVYRGYHFPKGATVVPNVWAISHDEIRYPDPFSFNPTRFFDEDGNLNDDTVSYAFGFGRRICVGRALAEGSLWSAIANLLAVFSFEAPLDESGKPVKIEPQFTTGVTIHPEPFPCQITLRMQPEKLASLLGTDD